MRKVRALCGRLVERAATMVLVQCSAIFGCGLTFGLQMPRRGRAGVSVSTVSVRVPGRIGSAVAPKAKAKWVTGPGQPISGLQVVPETGRIAWIDVGLLKKAPKGRQGLSFLFGFTQASGRKGTSSKKPESWLQVSSITRATTGYHRLC